MNANTTDSLRLFLALWPDDDTRAALMELQAPMRGRLVPYGNLHLTLAFLGQQPVSVLPALKQMLTRLPARPMMLTLDRIGYFTRKRIAWAGMHEAPQALLALQKELAGALAEHGIAFDNQHDFKPHVTLARDASLPPDIVFTPIVWRADRVALVRSTTRSDGVRYEVIVSRSLDQACRTPDEAGIDAQGPGSGMT